jgi:hypothetical protein
MSLITLNSTLKSKMVIDINNASSLDDLKKTVLSNSVLKGWVDTINRNRQLVYTAFGDDVGDDLVSLKYIGTTKKEWSCCSCSSSISIGSTAFRSFRQVGFGFDKLYRCVTCVDKIVSELEDLGNEAIHALAFSDCMPSHGQD